MAVPVASLTMMDADLTLWLSDHTLSPNPLAPAYVSGITRYANVPAGLFGLGFLEFPDAIRTASRQSFTRRTVAC